MSDETKVENSEVLVKSTQKPASLFDKNLAALLAFNLLLRPEVPTDQTGLMTLPNAIWLQILSFLKLQTDLNFCRQWSMDVPKSLGHFFQAHLKHTKDVRLKLLLQHVIHGKQTAVEKIIKKHPRLLLLRGMAEDYSYGMDKQNHRKNEGTAYQLAIGAEDVRFPEDEVCMDEMIEGYLIKLPNGKTELAKQTMQRFPLGWEAEEEKRAAQDSSALLRVITAIELATRRDCRLTSQIDKKIQNILCGIALDTHVIYNSNHLKKIIKSISKANSENEFESAFGELKNYLNQNDIIENPAFNFAVLKAIYQFRNYLEPRGIISIGKQFNMGLLDDAYKLYVKKFVLFGNYTRSVKNKFFWINVIGYIQRFFTACSAQMFAQSISDIESYAFFERSLKFKNNRNRFFFPLASHPSFQLGYDYAINDGGPGLPTIERDDPGNAPTLSISWNFSILNHAKKTSLQRIIQRDSVSRCSIM